MEISKQMNETIERLNKDGWDTEHHYDLEKGFDDIKRSTISKIISDANVNCIEETEELRKELTVKDWDVSRMKMETDIWFTNHDQYFRIREVISKLNFDSKHDEKFNYYVVLHKNKAVFKISCQENKNYSPVEWYIGSNYEHQRRFESLFKFLFDRDVSFDFIQHGIGKRTELNGEKSSFVISENFDQKFYLGEPAFAFAKMHKNGKLEIKPLIESFKVVEKINECINKFHPEHWKIWEGD